jgi:hypothetical protein
VVVGGVLRAGEGQWRSWKLTVVSPRPHGVGWWPAMVSFSAERRRVSVGACGSARADDFTQERWCGMRRWSGSSGGGRQRPT